MSHIDEHCFPHAMFPFSSLQRIDDPSGRYYLNPDTPDIKYKSVTNFLGEYYGTEWIEKWKKRVGEEEANRISGIAKTRGTSIHSIYEKFLLNEEYKKGVMPFTLMDFNKVKPYLLRSVSKVYGVELPLYSEKLQLAGTADAVIDWDGIPSILDFKTSKRKKELKDIESYIMQTTIYSIMVEERYGLQIPQIVIIMTVDHDNPIFFIENTIDYRRNVYKIVSKINDNISKR